MGLSYRKSFKLKNGSRINISKSGVGFSYGIKGFRISHNTKGTFLNINFAGFNYRKKIDFKNLFKWGTSNREENIAHIDTETIKFDNDFDFCFRENKEWEQEKITSFLKNNSLINFVIVLSFILFPLCFIGIILIILRCKKVKEIKTILKEEALAQTIIEECDELEKNINLFEAITLEEIPFTLACVRDFTDFLTPTLIFQDLECYFLKSGLLLFSNKKAFIVPYNEISVSKEQHLASAIEVPKNAYVVDTTYEHVNKDGSKNKRYKDNDKIHIIRAFEINISTKIYTNIPILCFEETKAEEFIKLIEKIKNG